MIFYDTYRPTRRRILVTELPVKPPDVRELQNDERLDGSNTPQHSVSISYSSRAVILSRDITHYSAYDMCSLRQYSGKLMINMRVANYYHTPSLSASCCRHNRKHYMC
ncbi:hypothetical protein L484_015362 [Morus notabilis]|uniref:Uncharacterized protein n=1 Tax=Morus notabilis TaxID=981085 RepID=W9RK99_9ROSA|nr:hypothetical protein L484_015362 [Morus notabilis]